MNSLLLNKNGQNMKVYIIIFAVILLLPISLLSQDEKEVLYCFDFGGAFQKPAPGYIPISRVYHSPRYLWIDNVNECSRLEEPDPLLQDFMSKQKGEFWIGLDNGKYEITLIMYDIRESHGPISISINEQVVQKNIFLKPKMLLKPAYNVEVKDNVLKIKLEAIKGETFILNGLIVSGTKGHALRRIFNNAPPDDLPSVDQVLKEGSTDARKALHDICEWFLTHRLPNGFLGDFEPEPGRIEQNYWWYTSAYPIRTFLAAYDIFGEKKYLDAALEILDKLVEEQMPSGAFQQIYRNKPTKDLTKSDVEDIIKNYWMNIADIGSITTALGIATHYVPEPRKTKYINSLKRYCEDWAMQWQKPDGGFANGMEKGVPQKEVYHTATATSAAAFTTLYIATGDEKYLAVAEKAANFLLDNWNEDGRPICHAHHTELTEPVYNQPVTHFGAAFYYSDGILMVYNHTKNQALKEKFKKVYNWYIKGEKGLLVNMGINSWWLLQDTWDNSKTAGIPLVFLEYKNLDNDPAIERAISICKRFLCTPEFAQRIGVMVEDSDLPWGKHSIQSWAGCTMAATGFAGLSIAEMVKPGVIFLKTDK
jgi:hypothetical protein